MHHKCVFKLDLGARIFMVDYLTISLQVATYVLNYLTTLSMEEQIFYTTHNTKNNWKVRISTTHDYHIHCSLFFTKQPRWANSKAQCSRWRARDHGVTERSSYCDLLFSVPELSVHQRRVVTDQKNLCSNIRTTLIKLNRLNRFVNHIR